MEVETKAMMIEARGYLQTTSRIQGGFQATIEGLCQLGCMMWLGALLLGWNGSVGIWSKH